MFSRSIIFFLSRESLAMYLLSFNHLNGSIITFVHNLVLYFALLYRRVLRLTLCATLSLSWAQFNLELGVALVRMATVADITFCVCIVATHEQCVIFIPDDSDKCYLAIHTRLVLIDINLKISPAMRQYLFAMATLFALLLSPRINFASHVGLSDYIDDCRLILHNLTITTEDGCTGILPVISCHGRCQSTSKPKLYESMYDNY